MENASFALKLVVSFLIAVVVISLITGVFLILKSHQIQVEEAISRDNIGKFNKAFEVYEKKLMYGTDVLSCLNKAENNNQQYVYNIYYGKDSSEVPYTARQELLIQVEVTLNTTIKEKVDVFYKTTSGAILQTTSSFKTMRPFADTTINGFKIPNVTFYYFEEDAAKGSVIRKNTNTYDSILWNNAKAPHLARTGSIDDTTNKVCILCPGTYNTNMIGEDSGAGKGKYKLYAETVTDREKTAKLQALLSTVNNVNQIIYKENYTFSDGDPVSGGSDGWYKATWTTAVRDFKTRKFTCTGIEYNDDTGYVSSISFAEVD